MHVLVTGGAGFIGSHSVALLLAAGVRVRVLDNFSTGKRENLSEDAELEVVVGDIRDEHAVRKAMQGISHVLHLAASVSVARSVDAPLNSAAHNVMGFLNVIEAARQSGVHRLVYASSAAVYGVPTEIPLRETAPANPISPYGLDKLVNEKYASLYNDIYGISTLGLRYFNVYGPRQDLHSEYSGVISVFCERLLVGQPLVVYGNGEQTRDFIFVEDIAKANFAALQGEATGICNVGTGRSVSLLQLIQALGETGGYEPAVTFAPPRKSDIPNSCADVSRLYDKLGLSQPIDLSGGLAKLWAFLESVTPDEIAPRA
jgi:UDP-glucose 4-epimerase